MNTWMDEIAGADEEYLIGLSNKGIVKRAYKDMEGLEVELLETGQEACLKVGGETCRIKVPLGDSRCSCASRSICKHLVIAVLKLKEMIGQQGEQRGTLEKTVQNEQTAGFPEILTYPLERLIKVLGSRRYQSLMDQVKSGKKPEIQETSMIKVFFSDTGMMVKLLEPLQYSTCSCHKKELCEHKAAAIIWYQLERGVMTEAALAGALSDRQEVSLEDTRKLAVLIKELLEDGLRTGLARVSPDIIDSIERMALLCHNGKLANYEKYLRALGDSYQQYFRRSASFQTGGLMMQTMRLYQSTKRLLEVKDGKELADLAGEFKSEYLPAGELRLIGIGARHFLSSSGYEGENYYFLEEQSKEWYVYSNSRPVFYETSKRQKAAMTAQVPWGLTVCFDELMEHRILLKHARVNHKNQISSSSGTLGEVTGSRKLKRSEVLDWYYDDFRRLFTEQIETGLPDWKSDEGKEDSKNSKRSNRLVLVQAQRAGEAVFDTINQVFHMMLYDGAKIGLAVEVAYSKEEAATIRYLERIARKVKSASADLPCFIGKVFIDKGMMKLYPIACLGQEEILDDRGR